VRGPVISTAMWWRRATKGQWSIAAIVQRNGEMSVEPTAARIALWNVEMIIAGIAPPGILRRRAEVSVEMIGRRML